MDTERFADKPSGEEQFSCQVERLGHTAEIELAGELDLVTRPTLDAALEDALQPGAVRTLVVDLTRVSFADSTTITWLLHASAGAGKAGAELVVVTAPGRILDLLKLTGLDERLKLVQDGRMR